LADEADYLRSKSAITSVLPYAVSFE